jgi:hypothetical protein
MYPVFFAKFITMLPRLDITAMWGFFVVGNVFFPPWFDIGHYLTSRYNTPGRFAAMFTRDNLLVHFCPGIL